MNTRPSLLLVAVPALAVAIAALAACGGGDDDAAPSGTAPAAAARSVAVAVPANSAASTRSPAPTADISELRQQLARLDEAVVRLGQRVDRLASAAAQPQAAAATQSEARGIDSMFREEPVDAGWSAQATAAVRAAFASDATLAAHIHQVECRARTCRVEVASEGTDFVEASLSTIAMSLAGVLSHAATVPLADADGRPSMLVFFSR